MSAGVIIHGLAYLDETKSRLFCDKLHSHKNDRIFSGCSPTDGDYTAMDVVAFYSGALLIVLGLGIILFGKSVSADGSQDEVSFASFRLKSRKPGFIIAAIGVILMLISPRFPPRHLGPHEVQNLDREGDLVNFSCGEEKFSYVEYAPPSGFKIADAQADTKDVQDVKSQEAAVLEKDAHHLKARARFVGRDKTAAGLNCPSGGQGRVLAHVTIETE